MDIRAAAQEPRIAFEDGKRFGAGNRHTEIYRRLGDIIGERQVRIGAVAEEESRRMINAGKVHAVVESVVIGACGVNLMPILVAFAEQQVDFEMHVGSACA